ncbi:leptomycin b resistance pmd1 [Fusarium napiforme]|uniref:Leptomycin b resistance pmd1 n=1 Tax=Fusarium napiforme TaxID=42672 RepID=A0A8H5MJC2_9HYPO|nr:leptomycin b resistance pmd1 [Fusarium napiforme]
MDSKEKKDKTNQRDGVFEHSMQAVAIFATICSGAGIALQNLIFAKLITLITDFTSAEISPAYLLDNAATLALCFAYLVAFFDFGTGGSIAAQASSNGRLIQGNISKRLGLLFQGTSIFITAFTITFIFQWKLTLIYLCIAPAPLNGAAAGIMAGHETDILEIHSRDNSFTESILSSARIIHAFEMRDRLSRKYDIYLTNAHHVGNKISSHFGTLLLGEYCIVYLGYGLAFWQGI